MLESLDIKKDNLQITSLHFKPKKMASYLNHTAQPITFAAFPPWRILRSWLFRTCRCKGRK